jgi:hypothetical protein
MIINPASGPGYTAAFLPPSGSTFISYNNQVCQTRTYGIKVLAYLTTNYRDAFGQQSDGISRTLANIQNVYNEIDTFLSRYPGLDGFFFDEMNNDGSATSLTYYQSICNYIKRKAGGLILVQNPGSSFPEAYIGFADIFMSYENARVTTGGLNYVTDVVFPSWQQNYPATKFWHAIYNCSAANYPAVLAKTRTNNVGYVWITDDVLPNPYDVNPTYLTSLAADVRDGS